MAEFDHEIFRIFRSGVHLENDEVTDLIDVKNNIFYLFDIASKNVLVTSSTCFTGIFDIPDRYQVFEPRKRIYGEAKTLRASENNTRVAVTTDLGLYVVELPHIWTCLMMPHTAGDYTSSEVWMVSAEVEKMASAFVYKVLQVRWHPWQYDHLLALYNDNFLRLLDAKNHTLLRTLSLGRHPTSAFSTLIPLHEHTVDFDFAPFTRKSDEAYIREEASVLLLNGTGDVSFGVITKWRAKLDEPLQFHSEKNSTIKTACSMVVLSCQPTVVVIASLTGVVSHCVLLGEGNNKYLKVFEDYNLNIEETRNSPETYLLLKDPGSIYRYFVLHAAGIHAVMLPLIAVIEHILAQENKEDIDLKLKVAMRETESIVRQLVKTRLPQVTQPRPPLGVGLIPFRMTMTKALVLLEDCRATVHLVDSMFPSVSDFLNKPTNTAKETRKPFSAFLGNYLLGSKSSKPPVLKVGDSLKNASPETTLQFLRTYFKNLKEDRIKKHTVVVELIDAKARDIAIEYNCQLKQLEKLKFAKESLKQNAEKIAEQYEETNERQTTLQKRLEMIGLRINAPEKSVSEEKMRVELLAVKQKTAQLLCALQQAQALYEHRKTQELFPNQQVSTRKPTYLSEQRRRGIKENLMEMSKNIQDMKERIDRLNNQLNFIN